MPLSVAERTFLREFITQLSDLAESASLGYSDLKDGPIKDFINSAAPSLIAVKMDAETLLRKHAQAEERTLTPEEMRAIKLNLDKGLEYMERLHP